MATVTVNRDNPIKHHCQDHYNDCGRACAQMVITSFILGRGANPSTPLVTQKELEDLEQNPPNNGWFTDPSELLRMLRTATELKPESWQTEWHLGVYDTVEELLADILLALDAGRPSCITMQGNHWNVVTGASFGANKKLKSLRYWTQCRRRRRSTHMEMLAQSR